MVGLEAKEKIIFIGHSYHKKTKSHEFFIDYLKEFFDVEEFYDESWEKGLKPDILKICFGIRTVVFWQIPPEIEVLAEMTDKNVIFCPMFDQSPTTYFVRNFKYYRFLKIISFSKKLHEELTRLGFDSYHIKYFPKPKELLFGKSDEVFFWQRTTAVNINVIAKILQNFSCKIHLHTAIDPTQKVILPTTEQEKKFQITYSNWFDDKEEFAKLIKEKAIYIAPRFIEGIGLSFLEAMAMGKVVIANDEATMNEYIENGVTGFLRNFKKPKNLQISDIKTIQKNTHQYISNGYEQWLKDRINIITIIKNPGNQKTLTIRTIIHQSVYLTLLKLKKITVNILCWFVFTKKLKNKLRGRKYL